MPTSYDTDVLLIGGGIMSATAANLILDAAPGTDITILERLDGVAQESSAAWHNAGTGHAGLCELNYTPLTPNGIDTSKATQMNTQFSANLAQWRQWSEDGTLGALDSFLTPVPHMSFVSGEDDVEFLRARHEALRELPGFGELEFSTDPNQIAEWAPLLVAGRGPGTVAATWHPGGYDVDFGALTRQLVDSARRRGVSVRTGTEVTGMTSDGANFWTVTVRDNEGTRRTVRARRVVVAAGGWSLKLLQSAGLPQVRGYGLLPVSGQFLHTSAPSVVTKHHAKVYGKAPTGAPPMSMPHLDSRVIDGKESVLFGPFAGTSPKFLLQGHAWDALASLRGHNLAPMASMAAGNLSLAKLLLGELASTAAGKERSLREFAPTADLDAQAWTMRKAGQRAQIVKPGRVRRGELQFGTEVVRSNDGSLVGILGASPGASTAVSIVESILASGF